ncbi:hypothetical protein Tco_0625876 [Tanacetum coccineum]|uniref:Uncharacterized protein n=1 Tax=Tanacetum coccineum TaxID=301880 RepID=A0ABQ4WI66_9ASTR
MPGSLIPHSATHFGACTTDWYSRAKDCREPGQNVFAWTITFSNIDTYKRVCTVIRSCQICALFSLHNTSVSEVDLFLGRTRSRGTTFHLSNTICSEPVIPGVLTGYLPESDPEEDLEEDTSEDPEEDQPNFC